MGRSATDPSAELFRTSRTRHWDSIAVRPPSRGGKFYHARTKRVFEFLIPPGKRVLEIGCGRGDLLSALNPTHGVGIDLSSEMIEIARAHHPNLTFEVLDATDSALSKLGGSFDHIILSDVANDMWDVQTVLERLRPLCTERTRIAINHYNTLWRLPLGIARRLGLATPLQLQNWLSASDVSNLLNLAGFEVIKQWGEILLPIPIPFVSKFANRFVVKLPFFRNLALTNFVIARTTEFAAPAEAHRVSVVVPARNEAGHIEGIVARTPELGLGTEILFVEGGSTDDTYEVIERTIAANPHRNMKLLKQSGKGKGAAVRDGFAAANGEVLMILDADITVPPEDLERFYNALVTRRAEFINGVRLVYPMEERAMRLLNLFGNKFFSVAFSWLFGQPIKDTLCGTKVLWRHDYQEIAARRSYFGSIDPFGDFDLLFGASLLNLKIIDVPIRYRERAYGDTNISRWSHGWLLLRMLFLGARRLKFI